MNVSDLLDPDLLESVSSLLMDIPLLYQVEKLNIHNYCILVENSIKFHCKTGPQCTVVCYIHTCVFSSPNSLPILLGMLVHERVL